MGDFGFFMNKIIFFLNLTFLVNFLWYRKMIGGNWEKWWVDYPVAGSVWHHSSEGDLTRYSGRPTPLCRGCPEQVEWYSLKKEIEELTK